MARRVVPNRDVKKLVDERTAFRNRNHTMVGRQQDCGNYVVYSYGSHWPLYVYSAENATWYGNSSKCSQTTSCHASHARPSGPITWVDVETIKKIARYGVAGAVAATLREAA